MSNIFQGNGYNSLSKLNHGEETVEGGDFIQEVINDNDKIFEVIKQSIENAKFEVLIASSWFTDNILFDLLLNKLESGVKVSIVLAENSDNEKLPFYKISDAGGFFVKIKSVGYGIMHQKFCVIDQVIAIHGSYNYTLNARNNNHESVIYTTHKKTVKNLLDTFNDIKMRAVAIKSGIQPVDTKDINNTEKNLKPDEYEEKMRIESIQRHGEEFGKVLDSLIEAEISHFNRKELYDSGFARSESCSGDYNILTHSLDSIYYNFINDTDISADQKKMLLIKINEYKSKKNQELDIELAQKHNIINIDNLTKKEHFTRLIKEKSADIEKNINKIDNIIRIDIDNKKKIISGLRSKILELKSEYIKPKQKFFELIPLVIFNVVLLIYLVLFYSSAAYILIYGQSDIQDKVKRNLEVPSLSVFEPNAISNAAKHGYIGLAFVLLFFMLPLAFTLSDRFVENKKLAFWISNVLGLGVVDLFVAIFISRSIQEAKVLTNESKEHWNLLHAISDINFYLVFILGAMALLIFRYTYNKLMLLFEERSPTVQTQKSTIEILKIEDDIKIAEDEINHLQREIEKIQMENIDNKKQKHDYEYLLDNLPVNEARELQKVQLEFSSIRQHCDLLASIYINKIENNNPPISIDALKDRINTYLEGWNDFLHGYFAYNIAIDKSANATNVVNSWLENKLANTRIDSRLN